MKSTIGLIFWVALAFGAAAIGGLAGPGGMEYQDLAKPSWSPPGWVFAPVWTMLYILMGTAAWMVWREGGFLGQKRPLTIWIVQLALNALWTWIFFAWNLRGAAFIEILLLLAAVAVTLLLFWRVRPVAGALMVPYLAWVTFAAALNFSIWRLNA